MTALRWIEVANSSKALPVANPAVIFRSLTDGAVLFSTENEVYYGLNGVGARVWELLSSDHRDLDGLCEALAAEYPDAPAGELRRDIEELLDDLRANRLVLSHRSGEASAQDIGGSDSQSDGAERR